jgi:hypothetical protein
VVGAHIDSTATGNDGNQMVMWNRRENMKWSAFDGTNDTLIFPGSYSIQISQYHGVKLYCC